MGCATTGGVNRPNPRLTDAAPHWDTCTPSETAMRTCDSEGRNQLDPIGRGAYRVEPGINFGLRSHNRPTAIAYTGGIDAVSLSIGSLSPSGSKPSRWSTERARAEEAVARSSLLDAASAASAKATEDKRRTKRDSTSRLPVRSEPVRASEWSTGVGIHSQDPNSDPSPFLMDRISRSMTSMARSQISRAPRFASNVGLRWLEHRGVREELVDVELCGVCVRRAQGHDAALEVQCSATTADFKSAASSSIATRSADDLAVVGSGRIEVHA